MVIIQNKTGQLANRLFVFSHFIANAIEYDYQLLNPTLDEYARYFPRIRDNDFPKGNISVRSIFGLPYPLFKWVSLSVLTFIPKSPWHLFIKDESAEASFDLTSADFLENVRSDKCLVMRGWGFRDFKSHLKHRDVIKTIFAPDTEVMDWVGVRLADSRATGKRIIGVHIRRGDYALWEGGRFYYTNEEYLQWMLQLARSSQLVGIETVFVICSNEVLSSKNFPMISVIMANGDLIQDLYLLAGCDYLIGPPSTFSLWASFYGDVPLLHLRDGQQSAEFAMFEYPHKLG
jgi:Glycosyl transferase family 11